MLQGHFYHFYHFYYYIFRCWANETAFSLGIELEQELPRKRLIYDIYKQDYRLHV